MRFIKVLYKYASFHPLPRTLDPSSHLYKLHRYVREISPPKSILGLGGGGGGGGEAYFYNNLITHSVLNGKEREDIPDT